MMGQQSGLLQKKSADAKQAHCAMPIKNLLTVAEVATFLRVSRRTVERLVGRGLLPFIALPLRRGGLRFRQSEVEKFLADRHQDSLD